VKILRRSSTVGIAAATLMGGVLLFGTLSQGAAASSKATLVPDEIVSAPFSKAVYVLANSGCDQAKCLRLVRTNISGDDDTEVTLPPVTSLKDGLGNSTLQDITFANASDGYAVVGATRSELYVTHNGATSWQKVSGLSGLDFERLEVSANAVYVTLAKCKSFDDDCVDVTVARSRLWPIHWVTFRLPTIPNNGLNGGIPLVSVDASSVWLSQWQNNAEVIWRTINNGKTYQRFVEPKLVSINGCSLVPTSSLDLWAECPTGMLVSFFYSNDGGATWVGLPQRPYGGTGGGFFAPVSDSLAYLDYGETSNNFYRVDMHSASAVHVGEVRCSDAQAAVFSGASKGLVDCVDYGSVNVESFLLSTTDGGVVWSKVGLAP
jgi:hypothetical protein